MATLIPGANAALTVENPQLDELLVGLGWSVVSSRGPQSEPVPAAILCDASGAAISDEHLVFFNQIADPAEAVRFAGDEDQEQIDVKLSLVPAEVEKIVFTAYIDPDVRGPGTFASVRNTYIRIAESAGRELVRFNIPTGLPDDVTALVFGELYRHAGGWKFRAIGQGYSTGLDGLSRDFRVSI